MSMFKICKTAKAFKEIPRILQGQRVTGCHGAWFRNPCVSQITWSLAGVSQLVRQCATWVHHDRWLPSDEKNGENGDMTSSTCFN